MKTVQLLLLTILISTVNVTLGQVPKQVILEHFTNTKCSVCGIKNPDLNTNLSNNEDVIRISYHPSSPYATCVFNQHNVNGNDDRTNQYGVYGGTPVLVIQGSYNQTTNFGDPALFDNYYGEESPILLNTYIDSITIDSTYVKVVATTVAPLSLVESYSLYAGLAEDTIYYNAPNGETSHYNVFRTALNGNQGTSTSLNSTIGDSVILYFKTRNHVDWNLGNLTAFSVLQSTTDLSVLQSSISSKVALNNSYVSEQSGEEGFELHFNGTSEILSILKENCQRFDNYEIVSINGQIIQQGSLTGNLTYIGVSKMPQGIYLVRLSNKQAQTSSKAVKFVKA